MSRDYDEKTFFCCQIAAYSQSMSAAIYSLIHSGSTGEKPSVLPPALPCLLAPALRSLVALLNPVMRRLPSSEVAKP